jgi:signal transduction histidine kinase
MVEADRTLLTIEDDGCGIPTNEREKVFERFYRGAATDKPGTGLGLAIVKEIATTHNATTTVASGANGKGTSITISFPKNG